MEAITNYPINVSSEIPSPIEWVKEHYSIASLIDTLADKQKIFSHGCLFQDSEDEELVIDANLKDALREEYGYQNWEYLEKYFFINE
ncbi:MAG: hypothetical protein F6K22_22230 [Okeania sp. SIO2F4]|uniref:hypothetical protein n=1 Tax=Okeania sp. SIO2F4 TaxID=2607790 RepID=UPI00142A9E60|nr:hypothetical protein [Okeania sp. SIO2F4]NES05298.1 hypothetical protein [Okeania sp. SIO2F4]